MLADFDRPASIHCYEWPRDAHRARSALPRGRWRRASHRARHRSSRRQRLQPASAMSACGAFTPPLIFRCVHSSSRRAWSCFLHLHFGGELRSQFDANTVRIESRSTENVVVGNAEHFDAVRFERAFKRQLFHTVNAQRDVIHPFGVFGDFSAATSSPRSKNAMQSRRSSEKRCACTGSTRRSTARNRFE